jgi:hypothetical protein
MTEQNLFMLSPKELTKALIKHHGIHEGIWGLAIEFQLAAAKTASDKDEIMPAAMVSVHRIGISKADKLNDMAVDAATVNRPARSGKRSTADRMTWFSQTDKP